MATVAYGKLAYSRGLWECLTPYSNLELVVHFIISYNLYGPFVPLIINYLIQFVGIWQGTFIDVLGGKGVVFPYTKIKGFS